MPDIHVVNTKCTVKVTVSVADNWHEDNNRSFEQAVDKIIDTIRQNPKWAIDFSSCDDKALIASICFRTYIFRPTIYDRLRNTMYAWS